MITMTNFAEIHGPRLRMESLVPAAGCVAYAHAWKQLPSRRRALGTVGLVPNTDDNSTGVSAQERRHR